MNGAQWATFMDACQSAGNQGNKSAALAKLQGELDWQVCKKFGNYSCDSCPPVGTKFKLVK